jgi:hypothetical protein
MKRDNTPSWEELESSILESERSSEIPTKCTSCGFTENVPDFIYGEFAKKKFYIKFRKSISTIACQKCQKFSAIPLSFFKD